MIKSTSILKDFATIMSVFEEVTSSRPRSPQRGPSPSLLQTTKGRLSDSQTLYEQRMQKLREGSYTAPEIGDYEPSKSLLAPTEARKHDAEAWLEHQREIQAASATPSYFGRNFSPPSKRLLSSTANRENDSQALADKKAAEDLAKFVPYLHSKFVPSASMLQTTAARLADSRELEERKRRSLEPASYTAPKVSHPVAVSDHLLEPTQSIIASQKAWEEEKERAKYADDIWWELRRPTPAATYKGEVQSKINEPTESFKHSIRGKLTGSSTPPDSSATSSPARPIPADSHLLKTTHASVQSTWRATSHDSENDNAELGILHLVASGSYDHDHHVTSRLHNDTVAARQQRYLSQHQPAKTIARNSMSPVNISSHLLKATAATAAASREKLHPKRVDNREAGFNLHCTKDHVIEANPFNGPDPLLTIAVQRSTSPSTRSPVKTVMNEVKVVDTGMQKVASKMDMMLAMMHSPLTKINEAAMMDDDDTIVVQGAEDRDIGMRDFNDDTMSQIEVDVQ